MVGSVVDALKKSFVWGPGGSAMTPEEIAKQRQLEKAILARGVDTSPVGHWTQGLARVADAAAGAVRRGQLDSATEESRALGDAAFAPVADLLKGGSATPSSMPTSSATGEISATAPGGGSGNYRDAIASIESAGSGDYGAVGPRHPKMGRALGRYQIMESNIGPWSEAALGRSLTPNEFMANPQLQDAIFDHRFGQYVDKFGPEGAAQAWFGGEGGVGKTNRKDVLGTTIGGYGQKFMNALGGGEVASADPQQAFNAILPQADGGASLADEVAEFRGTPEFMQAYPGGYNQQTLSDQQFNDRFGGGEAMATPFADAGQQPISQQAIQQQAQQTNPVQMAQVTPDQGLAMNEALVRAITNPHTSSEQKAVAQALLQQQLSRQQAEQEMRMKQADPAYQLGLEKSRLEVEQLRNPRLTASDQLNREKFDWERENAGQTNDIKNYQFYADREIAAGREPLGPLEWEVAQKKAGAASTNVTVGEGDKFYEALDKKNAETFAALSEAGTGGRARLAQLEQLDTLLKGSPVGAGANVKLWLGDLGINTEGLDGLQATRALIEKMVPEQRQAGSGPMSDADIVMYRRSLANVSNQPGGNELIIGTAKAISNYDIQMGEIADMVADREITAAEGRKMIRGLKNPLEGYSEKTRELLKKNEGSAPMSGAVVDGYRFKGGDPADPANWEKQ